MQLRLRRGKRSMSGSNLGAAPAPAFTPETLEPRLLMAAARAQGLSGFSGTLSQNAAVRQQQLICDPPEPLQGQTSVLYDAAKVKLRSYLAGPGYQNDAFRGFLEVRLNGTVTLIALDTFFNLDEPERPPETGYVQIYYTLTGTAGQIAPADGYTVMEDGGVTGMDTHQLFFQLLPGVPDDAAVSYTIMSAQPNMRSGNQGDYLTYAGPNGPQRLEWYQLEPAVVSNARARVYTGSTSWKPAFRDYLNSNALGLTPYGYRAYSLGDEVDFGSPWTNINQLTVVFESPLPQGSVINASRVKVTNRAGQAFPVHSVQYDGSNRAARIQLAGSLPTGQYKVSLDIDAYPGGDREALVTIKQADTNSDGVVNATDLVRTRNTVGRTAANPGTGPAAYSPFTDVNGDAAINAADLVLVRNRIGAQANSILAPSARFFADLPIRRVDEVEQFEAL